VNTAWDPTILARAKGLMVKSRQLVSGHYNGMHRSPRAARSIEFIDHKPYVPGDPIKDIDWRAVARTEKLLIRRQQAETDLNCIIALDASGDMDTADGSLPVLENSKFGRAITLASSLAIMMQRSGDRVGLLILGGQGFKNAWLPPRSSRSHISMMIANMAATQPVGEADLKNALKGLSQHIKSRTVLFLFSDLMEEPESWGPSLRALASKKIDIRIGHVFSEKEMALDIPQNAMCVSQEHGQEAPIEVEAVKERFEIIVSDYFDEVGRWSASCGAICHRLPIEENIADGFLRMVRGVP